MSQTYDIAVIGGGSAGTMAYLRSVLNYDNTLWLLGDASSKKKARATWVFEVENIPGMQGLPKPILGPAASTRKWVESHPHLKEKSTVIKEKVTELKKGEDDRFVLTSQSKKGTSTHHARYVILATGVMDKQPLIDGSIEPVFPFANRGDFIYCLRCDGHQAIGHQLAVIGGGDTGLSIANLMHERYAIQNIHVLTHGDKRPPSPKVAALSEKYGVVQKTSPIQKLLGDPKAQGLEAIILQDGTEVRATKAIVALGSIVYNDLLKNLGGQTNEDGRIVVDKSGETSVRGLFAVGDLVAGKKMQIYTGWDEAVDAADKINARLRASRRPTP